MEITIGHHRIRPYRDTCWQLDEWVDERIAERGEKKGELIPAGWRALDIYPTTLPYAYQMVWEREAKRSPERKACKEAIAALEEMTASLVEAAKR